MFHPAHHNHPSQNHGHQNQSQNQSDQRTHVIMSPEEAASGRKPNKIHGLEITGQVRNISPSLWNMTHLTCLYLNDNCLNKLPPDIGKLTQLRCLDLSSNKLKALPREIGELILLEELLLNDNQLKSLPLEMGKLFHLKTLGLRGNISLNPEYLQLYQGPKGTQKLIAYLLEHYAATCPAPRAPQRPWILMNEPDDKSKPCMFTTMCYNVLCDKYATKQLYAYCPSWALNWEYRRHSILEEIKLYSADIIALQEVETEQFHDYFLRELQLAGYDGIFSPKSRAKTMLEPEKKHVDGCAIFYKTNKFSLVQDYLIEFNQLAMANADGSANMLNRVMTKDNIAVVALLQIKDAAFDSFQTSGGSSNSGLASGSMNLGSSVSPPSNAVGGNGTSGIIGSGSTNNSTTTNLSTQPLHQQRLLVCSAHIHWDPDFSDVKIMQTFMMMRVLENIANNAAKDLVLKSGQDLNMIKQYYLRHGDDSGGGGNSIRGHNHIGTARASGSSSVTTTNSFNNNQKDDACGGDDPCLNQLGPSMIPMVLCGDFNSLPESSVVEFLSKGTISPDHGDFKGLSYENCLKKINNSNLTAVANPQHSQQQNQSNQYSGQSSKSSSISTTISSSSASSTDEQKLPPNDSLTNTSDGNGNQRAMSKNGANHNSMNSTQSNSDFDMYTHPFLIATAYTGDGKMPYTNYTFDFRGVIDYIFYSENLMSVLGVSGLDKAYLEENKIPGLPHPYFPSDHFPLYVELEILSSPRSAPTSRQRQPQNLPQHQSQFQTPQHKKNDFIQTPMRKPFLGT